MKKNKRKYLSEKEVEYLMNQAKILPNIYPIPKTPEEVLRVFKWWYGARHDKQGWYVSEKVYYLAFTIENIKL